MARLTPKGLYVWDLNTDQFNHSELASNWDLVDDLLDDPANQLEISATVPASGNFAGRLVFLSAANGGFPAYSLLRYGTDWRPVGQPEIQPTVPSTGNFSGRIVILSAASGNFSAWDVIRFDGTAWDLVGGFKVVNTGGAALNIQGNQTNKDIYVNDSARGVVFVDRGTGAKHRLYLENGVLKSEVVT